MFRLLARQACGSGRRATMQLMCDGKFEVRQAQLYVFSAPLSLRNASTASPNATATTSTLDKIPEPPPVPETIDITETVQALSANGEPTFASLGLGSWWPPGMVQNCFEYLHVSLDMPWWAAIMLGTVVVRSLMFPLVVIAQRNAALMNNNLPQIQTLQLKMTRARQSGNQLESARYTQEMMVFMNEKGLNPLKNMAVPLAQAPFFVSFFMGLRGMANCPVESMTHGGLWWFTDLTVPDQYYILPFLTSATMWLTIELGVDGNRLDAQNMQMMKYVLRALPLVMFPFTLNFSGAILVYWTGSNFISVCQAFALKIPAVREFLKIPKLIKHNKETLPIQQKGFVAGAKESWTNMKLSQELSERARIDEILFTRAGKGPVTKTYKFDPTSVQTKSK